jgi:Flp pilus assembly pilin Flp
MSEEKSNSGLLAVIAVVLIAIMGLVIYEMNDEPDTVGEAVGEAAEDIGDSIEDSTD